MKPTAKQLDEWSRRVFALLAEVEGVYGDNPAGTYPKPIEMHLWLTHTAIRAEARAQQEETPDDLVRASA